MANRLDRIESLLMQVADRQLASESRSERIEQNFERLQLQTSETNASLDRTNVMLQEIVEGQRRNDEQIGCNAEAIAQLRAEVAA